MISCSKDKRSCSIRLTKLTRGAVPCCRKRLRSMQPNLGLMVAWVGTACRAKRQPSRRTAGRSTAARVSVSAPFRLHRPQWHNASSVLVPMADGVTAGGRYLPAKGERRLRRGCRRCTRLHATGAVNAEGISPRTKSAGSRADSPWSIPMSVGPAPSFGQWYIPYLPQEAKDIGALARWIAQQALSNGKVVMTGKLVSGYDAALGPCLWQPGDHGDRTPNFRISTCIRTCCGLGALRRRT